MILYMYNIDILRFLSVYTYIYNTVWNILLWYIVHLHPCKGIYYRVAGFSGCLMVMFYFGHVFTAAPGDYLVTALPLLSEVWVSAPAAVSWIPGEVGIKIGKLVKWGKWPSFTQGVFSFTFPMGSPVLGESIGNIREHLSVLFDVSL